jgi:predicted DNA binding protein
VLVEYDADKSINDALVFRGYIPDKPVRMVDGREYWTVLAHKDRTEIDDDLDAIRDEMDAVVEVDRIASGHPVHDGGVFRRDPLSERQREVFQLALDRGYYAWPRQTSAVELADELDVSKPTLLEQLRKAESKLIRSLF